MKTIKEHWPYLLAIIACVVVCFFITKIDNKSYYYQIEQAYGKKDKYNRDTSFVVESDYYIGVRAKEKLNYTDTIDDE